MIKYSSHNKIDRFICEIFRLTGLFILIIGAIMLSSAIREISNPSSAIREISNPSSTIHGINPSNNSFLQVFSKVNALFLLNTGMFMVFSGVVFILLSQIALSSMNIDDNNAEILALLKDHIQNNQMLAGGQELQPKNIQPVEIKRILTCSKCNKVYEKGFDGQYCEACGGELYLVDQFL